MNDTIKKKVSLEKCSNYNYTELKIALNSSVDNLGGIEKFINKGETVLLKVNLLMKAKPEAAVTVHPLFVKALAEILLDNGINVIIGDSPGGPFKKLLINNVYKITGMSLIVSELNGYISEKKIPVFIKLNDNYKSFEKKK